MSNSPDLSNLSYNDLQELIAQAEQLRQSKRTEELKVLVDGFARKVEAAGFTVEEALKELQPYSKKKRAARGTAEPKQPRPVVSGTVYRNPETNETWEAKDRGRVVGWLQNLINQGHKAEEFVAQ